MREKIIIYCASGYGLKVHYLLDEEKYDVVAYADGNPELWGYTRGG